MDIILKGLIKSRVKDFGFIYCEDYDCDYFFHESSFKQNDQISKGDYVTFKLRPNRGREGSHAIDVRKIESISKKEKVKGPSKKLKYFFESKADLIIGLKHIKTKLEYQRSKAPSNYDDAELVIDRIDDLINIITDLLSGPYPNCQNISIDDINASEDKGVELKRANLKYWKESFSLQDFGNEIESVSELQTEKGRQRDFSIVWHEWKDNEKQYFYNGYSKDYFNISFTEEGISEQTTVYDNPPPPAKWNLIKIIQKGQLFYITSAPVREISQSSSVPAMPPKIGVIETAERILDKQRKVNEWQREIDKERIRKIEQFIGEANNIIANTPMLYIHDNKSVTIENDVLTIDFSKFLKKQNSGDYKNKYIDRKLNSTNDEFGNKIFEDYRPFWIIDGQHRVRGVHRNDNEQNIIIPLIIFPHGFNMTQTAKVFAEINTLQKKLNPLHELFMQHRFSIDHPTNIKRKFKDYSSTTLENAELNGWNFEDWIHSRANHLAYEILARLAKDGPLMNRVQFLPQNGDNNLIYISADQWVNYARILFERKCYKYKTGDITDYIYKPNSHELSMQFIDLFFEELNNYFKAWVNICNHREWPDGKDRWVEESRGKGLLQRKTHFIILIELYSLVRDLSFSYKKNNNLPGLIKVTEFLEILKPFKWVDWRDKELENIYPGSGEKGRRSLEVWMADAIIHGVQYSEFQVIDTAAKSKPGQGIKSILDVPSLEIVSQNSWPEISKPVVFRSLRPFNARYESNWKVEDQNDDVKAEASISTAKHLSPAYAEFILSHSDYMDDDNVKELTIRVDWKNSHTHTGKKIKKIHKPF